jgi:D-lactate dehydrogenase
MDAKFITQLKHVLPNEAIITDLEHCQAFGHDTSRYYGLPKAVTFPTQHQQIELIVKLCNDFNVPLTTRGLGSGTTGAAVPIQGGIVVSLEKMNQIITMDADNRVLIAEPGITNQQIQDEAKKEGFFWPCDPGSSKICTLGGNLACNAAGPHAVKYGTARENTLGLTAITGSGETIKTGVYTTKGVVGYDLTRLLIGSEGTLAIITQATLKLTPLPEATTTLRAFYTDIISATHAVSAIMRQPLIPSALEYVDGKALAMIAAYAKVSFPAQAQAMLIIEIDGTLNSLTEIQEKIAKAASNPGMLVIEKAQTPVEVEKIWLTRKSLSPALKTIAPKKINEDVVVPVARMPDLIHGIEKLAQQYDLTIINFGHAGNGNIHVNLMIDPADPKQETNSAICLEKIFDLVLQLNGTLSGEHGVGIDKLPFITKEINPATLNIMRGIKSQFDPKGILNPGKM